MSLEGREGLVERVGYIHGTEPSEQQRLVVLNGLTNQSFIEFLRLRPGLRVLEVGSGLGLLASEIAARMAGIHVTGVEISPRQIAVASASPGVTYLEGDGHHLDFPDASFDLVYARYLLEHVSDPEQVVREMRRVVVPAGRVAVCENDVTLLRLDPPCPMFERTWAAFQEYQRSLGGDALIGRRLHSLFRAAGFSEIELSFQSEPHWHGSPHFQAWVSNIIGNVESAHRGLVQSGLCAEQEIDLAVAELRSLSANHDASLLFTWNRAMAIR